MAMELLPILARKIADLLPRLDDVPEDRREVLTAFVTEIRRRRSTGGPIRLHFICTHNSRRSQLGQVWAAVAAAVHGVPRVETHSGGTEETAFNPRAVAALVRAGFRIEALAQKKPANPRYLVHFSDQAPPVLCFSKVFDAPENPADDFVAIMTCGEADQHCPAMIGQRRIPLLYEDPKAADDTDLETRQYDERSDQIAVELLWAFREARG